jgi:hypothetical protein
VSSTIFMSYRNVFPYFLPVLALPWCVLAASAWEEASRSRRRIFGVCGIAIVWSALSFASIWPHDMGEQRKLIALVHESFPEPVPYIDRCGMIASFPKVGPFLSTLVLDRYHRSGAPIFGPLIDSRHPRFVLLNAPALSGEHRPGLLEADRQVLGDSFPFATPVLRAAQPLPPDVAARLAEISPRSLFVY